MSSDQIDAVFDETRCLIAEEARLRQELGLPAGPSFYEYWAMTGDQLEREDSKLRRELGLPSDDHPESQP
jgi:hypothetical protein